MMRGERKFRLFLTFIMVGVVILAAFGPGGVKPVWACSCAMPEPPSDAFDRASAVFTGEVTYISGNIGLLTELRHLIGLGSGYGREVGIEVTDSWKGVESRKVEVRTGYGGGDCGYSFDVGKEYLIYTYSDNGYVTGICNRTTPVTASGAADDFTFLAGKPTLTLMGGSSSANTLPAAVGGVLVGFIGVFLFLRWKRGRDLANLTDGGGLNENSGQLVHENVEEDGLSGGGEEG